MKRGAFGPGLATRVLGRREWVRWLQHTNLLRLLAAAISSLWISCQVSAISVMNPILMSLVHIRRFFIHEAAFTSCRPCRIASSVRRAAKSAREADGFQFVAPLFLECLRSSRSCPALHTRWCQGTSYLLETIRSRCIYSQSQSTKH